LGRIPSLMNARYRPDGQSEIPNYLRIEDIIQKKSYLGRLLPKNEARSEVLQSLARQPHPAFADVVRFLDWEGQYLVILPELAGFQPLGQVSPTKLKSKTIAQIFLNLISAFRWLRWHKLRHPHLDLNHVMVNGEGSIQILGLEGGYRPGGSLEVAAVPHVDIRYAAPEVIARQSPGEKSDVFHLGALCHHFLTGRPCTRKKPYEGVRSSNRKLKKDWDDLLGAMLDPDPAIRPDWKTVWGRVCTEIQDDSHCIAKACPAWQPELRGKWLEKLEQALAKTEQGPRVATLSMCAGRAGRIRLNKFARSAEAQGYLVVQTWQDEPVARAYQTINEIIALVQLGFLDHIDRPDLDEAFHPLSEWQSADDLKRSWRQTLAHLVNSMVPGRYRGIVLILENFNEIDAVSLETLITFSGWMAPTPFLLVLTGPTLAHPHFRQFADQWQHPWENIDLPKPDAVSVQKWGEVHSAEPLGLQEIEAALQQLGSREIYFQHWRRDRNVTGEVWAWIRQIWLWLIPKEQLILKMLGCSQRPLSIQAMEDAFNLSQLEKHVRNLATFDLVSQTEAGFQLSIPIWGNWVRQELTESDRQHSLSRLLAYEQAQAHPDLVQVAYLADALNQADLAEEALTPVLESFLATWRPDTVWRLSDLYQRHGGARFEIFHFLAERLRWRPCPDQHSGSDHPLLTMMAQAQRHIVSGRLQSASQKLSALFVKRNVPTGLKAWSLVWQMDCEAMLDDAMAVAKGWRQWMALDKADLDPGQTDQFTARLAGAMAKVGREARSMDVAVGGLPAFLQRWVGMHRSWRAGLFDETGQAADLLLKNLPADVDPIWKGRIHQLHGNAMYRQYRPAEAIRCYDMAWQSFARTGFEPGLQDISFNLASAEKLAGRFTSSVARFQPLLKAAEAAGDERNQTQIIFNLMVCALYQNDLSLFDRWFEVHRRLTAKSSDPEEAIRRLSIWLQTALLRSKDEVEECLEQLESLAGKASLDAVLANEIAFGKRWAEFALGKNVVEFNANYPELVRWRHQLIDALSGRDGSWLQSLTQTIGRGFLGASHFFILSSAISKQLVPEKYLDHGLLRAFESHAVNTGANYARFLKKHFSHLRGLGDVPPEAWRRAMGLLSQIRWGTTSHKEVEHALLTCLHAAWPFSERGVCQFRNGNWVPLSSSGPKSMDRWVGEHLNLLQIDSDTEPLTTQFAHPERLEVRAMLLLPLRPNEEAHVMLWFLAGESHDHIGMRLDVLFRFYCKLFEWVFFRRQQSDSEIKAVPKPRHFQKDLTNGFGMVGRSQRMMEVKNQILQFAPSNLNIFTFGESGTGKELAASAIHLASNRAQKPFRVINCAHYPENLVEGELFGHARGAYTGATMERAGVLERVDGGTLFLDEIGDINAKVQSLLLRVIQEGEFSRIGETKVRKVDIRFITATNKNLHDLIDTGFFREDLFFRLVEVELKLPALRERYEDLPLLVNHFVQKHQRGRQPKFDRSFFDHLRGYHWPGNVRELESHIRKLLVQWPDAEVFSRENALPFLRGGNQENHREETLEDFTNQCRSQFIGQRLKQFGWNRTRAAESLGISRQQLSNLIRKYRLQGPE